MNAIDTTEVLRKAPRNCWIALNADESEVVGRGETVAEAVEDAKKHGVDDPIITWVPKLFLPSVYQSRCMC